MKEYKEKYEQALERAKNYHQQLLDEDNPEWASEIEELFPELKESEDERIRKELIELISCMHDADPRKKGWIAWLEKQGGITKLSEEEQNRFAKGVLSSCAMSFIDYLDAHKYEGKMCVSNGECEDIENAFHNAMWDKLHRYYCKYIKKQGEQKPTAWNEEDDSFVQDLTDYFNIDNALQHGEKSIVTWLNTLKERIKNGK